MNNIKFSNLLSKVSNTVLAVFQKEYLKKSLNIAVFNK